MEVLMSDLLTNTKCFDHTYLLSKSFLFIFLMASGIFSNSTVNAFSAVCKSASSSFFISRMLSLALKQNRLLLPHVLNISE